MEKEASSSTLAKDLASEYALRVALQTMKERCIALQRRMTIIEEENQVLRERLDEKSSLLTNAKIGENDEKNSPLCLQVIELSRQKQQLTEHINMVSNENRKLWSRLSRMGKEQQSRTDSAEKKCEFSCNRKGEEELAARLKEKGGVNTNLIRSKTFTQYSPNPYLKYKVIPTDGGCEQMQEVILNTSENKSIETVEEGLVFTYLNVDDSAVSSSSVSGNGASNENDPNLEAKQCIDGLQEMRREAMRQRQELNSALNMLENNIGKNSCLDCMKNSEKPEVADKNLETDESLKEIIPIKNNQLTVTASNERKCDVAYEGTDTPFNIILEKSQADKMDKTCPMCGNIFNSLVSFNQFREHVEDHFIDDSVDIEASIDRHFEFISHAVGDF